MIGHVTGAQGRMSKCDGISIVTGQERESTTVAVTFLGLTFALALLAFGDLKRRLEDANDCGDPFWFWGSLARGP